MATARYASSTEWLRSSWMPCHRFADARAVALADPVPRDEHDHGPADPDQQPVGARHVREREPARRLLPAAGRRQAGRTRGLERVPALPREDEVDRVLGEHGDERQHGDRQAGGDVELRDLRRPRQDERGPHDRQPEERGLERVRQIRGRRIGARARARPQRSPAASAMRWRDGWMSVSSSSSVVNGAASSLRPKVSSPPHAEGRRVAMRDRDDGVALVGLLPFEAESR